LTLVGVELVFYGTFLYWLVLGKNARLPLTLLSYLLLRFGLNQMYSFKLSDNEIWENPFSYSIIGYLIKGKDFLYSSHIGVMIICGLEWRHLGFKKIWHAIVAFVVVVSMVFLVFQIHYTVDILTALFLAHYCSILVDNQIRTMDYSDINMWVKLTKPIII
jgi:hypothetical protein